MFSIRDRRYSLTILTVVYTLGFLDQGLMSLLLQPIEEELGLNDAKMGFLTGTAFSLFFAIAGIPFAKWSDRGDRSSIAALAVGFWGAMVMLCFVASNFFQLVAVRIAAAVGGSGCMPPTYSLVGDLYPSSGERARAMAIYMLANPLAILLSFGLGGWLNEMYGWRFSFLVIGLPGLLAAVLVKSTITDARAGAADADRKSPRIIEVVHRIWHRRSCRNLAIGIVLYTTMTLGLTPWMAAFMMRSHGMRTTELGLALGLISGIVGAIGMLLGGDVVARWFPNDERAQMRISAVAIALLLPCSAAYLLTPQRFYALSALVPFALLACSIFGPAFALLQRLVTDSMRATTAAVVLTGSNLIGMGLGPQVIGLLSDLLKPRVGADSLRYSMLAMSVVAVLSAYFFWAAGRTVKNDLLDLHKVRNGEPESSQR